MCLTIWIIDLKRGFFTMEQDLSFLSSDGVHQIFVRAWYPEEQPRAVLQLTHGMVEYIDRYDAFARFLTSKGLLVVGQDLLGHGHTAKNEDELGYFGANPSALLVADMHTLREKMQGFYPLLPYFMLGHSMGSYLLRQYLVQHGSGLAGAIIMGTGFMDPAVTNLGLLIDEAIESMKGERYRSPLMAKLTTGSGPYAKYSTDGSDVTRSWLTKDTEIVKKYYTDPYCTSKFTMNGYKGMLEAVQFADTFANIQKMDPGIPVYLVSGALDPVGDMGKGVKKVFELFGKAGIRDVSMHLFDGDRHEILNETDREEVVYPDIFAWIEKHLA